MASCMFLTTIISHNIYYNRVFEVCSYQDFLCIKLHIHKYCLFRVVIKSSFCLVFHLSDKIIQTAPVIKLLSSTFRRFVVLIYLFNITVTFIKNNYQAMWNHYHQRSVINPRIICVLTLFIRFSGRCKIKFKMYFFKNQF